MTESFKKLKKRAFKKALLFTALFGVSAAALTFGALFTIFTLTDVNFPWFAYLLCALGAGVLVGGGVFLLLYPNEKRFARKLDEKYSLGEKAQTMVEFSSKEGAVLTLQREQTEEKLSTLPRKKKSAWGIVKIVLLPVVAIATLSVALALPRGSSAENGYSGSNGEGNSGSETPPVIEYYTATEDQTYTMQTLRANISSSEMQSGLKSFYLYYLDEILTMMEKSQEEEAVTVAEMTETVTDSMDGILSKTEEATSYRLILTEIRGDETSYELLKEIDEGIRESAYAYTRVDVNIKSYSSIVENKNRLLSAIQAAFTTDEDGLIKAMGEKLDSFQTEEEYRAYMQGTAGDAEQKGYLTALGDLLSFETMTALLEKGDGVIVALTALQEDLQAALNAFDGGLALKGDFSVTSETAAAFNDFVLTSKKDGGAALALNEQAYTVALRDHVVNMVNQVFSWWEIPQEIAEQDVYKSVDSGDPPPPPPTDGATVLDPSNGKVEYVPYPDVITAEYIDGLIAYLNSDPDIDEATKEQLRKYVEDYFNQLNNQ